METKYIKTEAQTTNTRGQTRGYLLVKSRVSYIDLLRKDFHKKMRGVFYNVRFSSIIYALSLRDRISGRGNPLIRHCEVASAVVAIHLFVIASPAESETRQSTAYWNGLLRQLILPRNDGVYSSLRVPLKAGRGNPLILLTRTCRNG
jgi:hypothetical protein